MNYRVLDIAGRIFDFIMPNVTDVNGEIRNRVPRAGFYRLVDGQRGGLFVLTGREWFIVLWGWGNCGVRHVSDLVKHAVVFAVFFDLLFLGVG